MSKRVVTTALTLSLLVSVGGPVMAMPRAPLSKGTMAAAETAHATPPHVSARKRAWFRHAVARILAGEAGSR